MINIQLQLACMFLSNVKAVLKARNILSTERNASPAYTLQLTPTLPLNQVRRLLAGLNKGGRGGCLLLESQGGGGGPAGATGQRVAAPRWQHQVAFRPNDGVQRELV